MRKLDRRTVLRGVLGGSVVSIALPRLDAMLTGGGTAYADGGPLPKRFGTWFRLTVPSSSPVAASQTVTVRPLA